MPSVSPSVLRTLLQFKFKDRVESTCVNDVSYDPESEEMTIVFQKRGTYKYLNVPIDTYTDFATAGKQGTYFNLYIRPSFSYEKVS